MKIVEDKSKAFPILAISGKMMGGPDTDELDTKLYGLLARGVKRAIIDLTECEWINNSGLSILIHHFKKFRDAGGELVLAGVTEKIERIMVISRLTEVFRIFENQNEALIGLNLDSSGQATT